MISAPEPQPEQPNPYQPPGPNPLSFEMFKGIDTQTVRVGVADERMFWCDGFFPLAPRNARTMPGKGPRLYQPPGGTTIVFFGFYNIASTPYAVVFLSNGAIDQVRTTDGAITHIAVAATITTVARNSIGLTQWGSKYLIIVAQQANGYFVWDGATLFTAGTVGPVVTMVNVGSGYKTVPSVTASGGTGTGATFSAAIANGVVTGVTVVNPGTGYLGGQTITLVFSGGNSGGSGANLTAVMAHAAGSGAVLTAVLSSNGSSGFTMTSVVINNGGSGYSQFTTITASGGSGGSSKVDATLVPNFTAGVITSVTITNPGFYTAATPVPTLAVTDSGLFFVTSVTIVSGGTGYSPSAVAACSGGGSPVSQATLSLTINASGVITAVTVTNGGVYGSNSAPTVTVTDTVINAAATASLMPFAIQGNAVETYQGRVWVENLTSLSWTAPGSFNNFATSAGGGNLTSNDSFLRVQYTALKQTNGFLYLIGDSSINYISGVQTSGSPPTTTFTNQNADPEVGTPWPATVGLWSRNIIFGNPFGAHVAYGAAVTKVSDDLDGVYNTVANFANFNPSAAKAIIFGKKVWMMLLPIVDPVSNAQVNKLLMWNGKIWFSSPQDLTLTYIDTQEINSILTAWGTDGANGLFPLFTTPTTGFTKTIQSRLWDQPGGYQFIKTIGRLWALLFKPDGTSATVTFSVDNETATTPYSVTTALAGNVVMAPENVSQNGAMSGLTISTTAADITLVSAALSPQIEQYRG